MMEKKYNSAYLFSTYYELDYLFIVTKMSKMNEL